MKFKGYSDEVLLSQLKDRFSVSYRIAADEKTALEMAKSICVEQTVEFPAAHIECDAIHSDIIGRLEEFSPCTGGYPGPDQLFRSVRHPRVRPVLQCGLWQLQPVAGDYRGAHQPVPGTAGLVPGPKYGVAGLRQRLGVQNRPPVLHCPEAHGPAHGGPGRRGLSVPLGGVDLIKDDHGLMDQTFSSYKDRVKAVCEAVRQGNQESGHHTAYVPNLSGSFSSMMDRVRYAEDCGAGGIMLAPGLVGYDTMEYGPPHRAAHGGPSGHGGLPAGQGQRRF